MTKQPLSLTLFSETDEQLGDDASRKYLVRSFGPIWLGDEFTPDCRRRVLMESASKLAKWLSALSEEKKGRLSAESLLTAGALLQAAVFCQSASK